MDERKNEDVSDNAPTAKLLSALCPDGYTVSPPYTSLPPLYTSILKWVASRSNGVAPSVSTLPSFHAACAAVWRTCDLLFVTDGERVSLRESLPLTQPPLLVAAHHAIILQVGTNYYIVKSPRLIGEGPSPIPRVLYRGGEDRCICVDHGHCVHHAATESGTVLPFPFMK
jgi:hypothetical protein